MKIIGKTENGFIFEATRNEVANLIGYYSAYQSEGCADKLKPGDEIRVAEMYDRLYSLGYMSKQVKEAKETLEKCASKLGAINPVIQRLAGQDGKETTDA